MGSFVVAKSATVDVLVGSQLNWLPGPATCSGCCPTVDGVGSQCSWPRDSGGPRAGARPLIDRVVDNLILNW